MAAKKNGKEHWTTYNFLSLFNTTCCQQNRDQLHGKGLNSNALLYQGRQVHNPAFDQLALKRASIPSKRFLNNFLIYS